MEIVVKEDLGSFFQYATYAFLPHFHHHDCLCCLLSSGIIMLNAPVVNASLQTRQNQFFETPTTTIIQCLRRRGSFLSTIFQLSLLFWGNNNTKHNFHMDRGYLTIQQIMQMSILREKTGMILKWRWIPQWPLRTGTFHVKPFLGAWCGSIDMTWKIFAIFGTPQNLSNEIIFIWLKNIWVFPKIVVPPNHPI